MVGISNPYIDPNSGQVRSRIFTNTGDGNGTVDIYRTYDLSAGFGTTPYKENVPIVVGAATILEDTKTEAVAFYKAEATTTAGVPTTDLTGTDTFSNKVFKPYADFSDSNSQLEHRFELIVSSLPDAGATATIKKTVLNQTFFTGNAVDLFVGKNIFEITPVSFNRKINLAISSSEVEITSLKLFTIDEYGVVQQTSSEAETLSFNTSGGDGSGDSNGSGDGDSGSDANSITIAASTLFNDSNKYIPYAADNTDEESKAAQTFVITVTKLGTGSTYQVQTSKADGSNSYTGSQIALGLGANTITVGTAEHYRQVNLIVSPDDVEISSLTVNGVEQLVIPDEVVPFDGTLKTVPGMQAPNNGWQGMPIFSDTDDAGLVTDTAGVETALSGSLGEVTVEP
jgi:uncharacterized protein YaiE (UPF0345 family)